jgi:hypothetical protein
VLKDFATLKIYYTAVTVVVSLNRAMVPPVFSGRKLKNVSTALLVPPDAGT